jgi:hypothetical protein
MFPKLPKAFSTKFGYQQKIFYKSWEFRNYKKIFLQNLGTIKEKIILRVVKINIQLIQINGSKYKHRKNLNKKK